MIQAPHRPDDTEARTARAEVTATLAALGQSYEELIVRGLEASAPGDVARLATLGEELGRSGAGYLADRIATLVHAVREGGEVGPAALLRAQTAARVFERVLSLDAAVAMLGGEAVAPDASVPPAASSKTTASAGPAPDRALVPVLEELAGLVEGLVSSGLTTATKATLDKLGASFKEASRLKLLRLATALRYVTDECGRFLAESEHFSARRLAFFLNRTWLLCRGLLDAIARDDRTALARLLLQSAPQPVASVTVAVLGVAKRALLDGSAAFEFRMRALAEAPGVPRGMRLVWSCVFGARPNVPAEAFLHLPQPQKFTPKLLLDPVQITITDAAIAPDDAGGGRVMLGPKSKVTAGKPVTGWDDLAAWDRARFAARLAGHRITPLDLEIELADEITITDYELGPAAPHPFRPEQTIVPVRAGDLELDAVVSTGPDGSELAAGLDELRGRKRKPPLYGLVHAEMARLVFQPLSALEDAGPNHLMISREKIDLAALMKTLDFTS